MTTLLLATLLFTPVTALSADDDLSIRDRVLLRRIHRLEQEDDFGMRTQTIRLGRNVRTRRMSPRRVIASTQGTVLSIQDGSVFTVELANGEIAGVRTLGAEAPLLYTGSEKEQCFALEAKVTLEEFVLGKTISLERDTNYHSDNEGRLLRYVRMNSLDVNGWMIENGYAFADSSTPHRRQNDYLDRQNDARDYERGLWGHFCEYNPNLDTIDVLE